MFTTAKLQYKVTNVSLKTKNVNKLNKFRKGGGAAVSASS